ncbi:MAG: hypothetical protein K6A37_02805 [Saccharofermentans sp.]|nr:hypothetical protein [Saccharofermentans sp.]
MRRISKTSAGLRAAHILKSNDGASIVLVSIIAIIIITGVIILRITTSSLWASADKQYMQDRAYVMATTMGDSIDSLIRDGTINLTSYTSSTTINPSGSRNDPIEATIAPEGDNAYRVTVRAASGNAEYVYSALYTNTTGSYTRTIQ